MFVLDFTDLYQVTTEVLSQSSSEGEDSLKSEVETYPGRATFGASQLQSQSLYV